MDISFLREKLISLNLLLWTCDKLHCLKYQRSRLASNVGLAADSIITNALIMNSNPHVKFSLIDLRAFDKMNDVYAVDLFTFQNVNSLLNNEDCANARYFLPFTCWCSAISIPGPSTQMRLALLEIAFVTLRDWYYKCPIVACAETKLSLFQAFLRRRGKTVDTGDLSSNRPRPIHEELCQTRDFDPYIFRIFQNFIAIAYSPNI
jgi:hypothetical protein